MKNHFDDIDVYHHQLGYNESSYDNMDWFEKRLSLFFAENSPSAIHKHHFYPDEFFKQNSDYFNRNNEFQTNRPINVFRNDSTELVFSNQNFSQDQIISAIEQFSQEPRLAQQIVTIDLSDSKFDNDVIKDLLESLRKFTNLKYLDLSNCNLEKIPEEIGELRGLRDLNLSRNYMYTSNRPHGTEVLSSLKKLEKLNLHGVQMRSVSSNLWTLKSLKHLDISSNRDLVLPNEIGNLKNLETLDISNINNDKFPKGVLDLEHLKKLNISSNNFTNIPKNIGNLINLEKIVMEKLYNLISISEEFGKLERLETLIIERCGKLDKLPYSISDLKSLKNLSLYDMRGLDELPNFSKLTELQSFTLHACPIQSLHPSFWQLRNLQNVSIVDTKISEISPEIRNFVRLEKINIHNSPINKIPKEIFSLPALTMLGLSGMNNAQVEKNCIFDLNNLKTLRIDNTFFHQLPEGIESIDAKSIDNDTVEMMARGNKFHVEVMYPGTVESLVDIYQKNSHIVPSNEDYVELDFSHII